MSTKITSKARPPRTVVVRVPGPQGRAGTASLGTVTVVNPDENPNINTTGTDVDSIYNFSLPRAAAFSVGSVSAGVNALDADVTDSGVDGDVSLNFTLPRSEISVGTVTEVNPDVTPSVSATTTDGDVALNFDLPAAAAFTVPAAAVVNPDVDPSVVATETDGNYSVQFDLPRAPDFTVGTVTAVAQGSEAVTDVGTNGDITLNFDMPKGDTGEKGDKGDKGDTGLGVPEPIGTTGQVIASDGTDAQWVSLDTDDVSEGSNLYYTDARVQDIAAPLLLLERGTIGNTTLFLSDAAKVVAVDSSSNITVTVPNNASAAFPIGTVVNVYRAGSGAVNLVGAAGVTVRNVGAISEQFGEVSLRKRGSDEWVLVGQVD